MSIQGIPLEMDFSENKVKTNVNLAPQLKKYLADRTSYVAGDDVQISIPTGRASTSILFPTDSFLNQTNSITLGATAGVATIDGNALSIYERLQVQQGGTLEDTKYLNRLMHVLNDVSRDYTDRQNDSINLLAQSVPVVGTNASLGCYFAGLNGKSYTQGATYTDNVSMVVPSGILGSFAMKALPLGEAWAQELKLILTIAPMNSIFATYSGAPDITDFTISNVAYFAKETILPRNIYAEVMRLNTLILPSYQWITDQKTVGASVTSINESFAMQYASVNSVLFWFQNQAANNALAYRSITSRPHHGVQQWNLLLNGINYPSHSIEGKGMNLMSLAQAFDALSSTRGLGILDGNTYLGNDSSLVAEDLNTSNSVHRRSVYALSLSRTNASSEFSYDGMDLRGGTFAINIPTKTAVAQAAVLYVACLIDVQYVFDSGTITVLR